MTVIQSEIEALEALEFLADQLELVQPCPRPRLELLQWIGQLFNQDMEASWFSSEGMGKLEDAYREWCRTLGTNR
ncbi:hypothetical protein [Pseudomonas aeruginosa]|uniref:hypothetical protein n=1 Tax=Pseudomonas aeruginosa TaxID=287 RepID=UPI003D2BC44F